MVIITRRCKPMEFASLRPPDPRRIISRLEDLYAIRRIRLFFSQPSVPILCPSDRSYYRIRLFCGSGSPMTLAHRAGPASMDEKGSFGHQDNFTVAPTGPLMSLRVELHPGDYITISASRFPFANIVQSKSASDDWVNSISRTLNWNSRARQKGFDDKPKQ